MKLLRDKVAIVSGASSGIGRAYPCAEDRLAEMGVTTAKCD